MDLAGSMNIVFHADLSHAGRAPARASCTGCCSRARTSAASGWGWCAMVRPWNEWLIVWGYDITQPPPEVDDEMATRIVHELVGDDTIPVTIRSTSLWGNNKMYATRYRDGPGVLHGRRRPPAPAVERPGLQHLDPGRLQPGLEARATCCAGTAGEALLDTYDAERAPVGEQIVLRANKSIEEFGPIFDALGLLGTTDPERDAGAHRAPARTTRRRPRRAARGAAQGARAQGLRVQRARRRARPALRVGRGGRRRHAGAGVHPRPRAATTTRRPGPARACRTSGWAAPAAQVSTHDLAGKGRFACSPASRGERVGGGGGEGRRRPRASRSPRT